VYTVLGVDDELIRDILGHWVGDGSNFLADVIPPICQTRGVRDIFIATMDGLSGFKEHPGDDLPRPRFSVALFTNSPGGLQLYCLWTDRKAFMLDLRPSTSRHSQKARREPICVSSLTMGDKYAVAIRSLENNWEDLSTFFVYPAEIPVVLIYTPLIIL